MELRQLEYFIAVASEMNFSRAAQRVHVVQSALSTSVGKLEKELGVELFDRSRQQITITPAGELFRDHARRVLHAVSLAKDSMSQYRGELSGTVEFGSLISFSTLDVPKVLGEFHRNYPLVRIRLRQSQIEQMAYFSAIADGSLDLALVSAPDRFPATVHMRLLSEEPMLFVCRPDHQLAQQNQVEISDLAAEDLIGFPAQFGLQRVVVNAFSAAGITPRMSYEVAIDFSIAAGLVRHGLGSIFMPASETNRFPDLRALPVHPMLRWKIFLARAAQEELRPAAARLAELLIASAPAISATD
ncbi:MAG: LysR family transcriptional regulator [Mycobacteriaceae bacterium]|nr:LysR family transcriptional regulator [Mycobacteriaceae bacterium]